MSRPPLDKSLSAPVSARGLFDTGSDGSSDDGGFDNDACETAVEVAGHRLRLLQRPFHPLNANALWPGAHVLAEWLVDRAAELRGRRILELGSATGAVAIVAARLGLDFTTSDVDDGEVEAGIAAAFRLNGLPPSPHWPHTWGGPVPPGAAAFDVVVASDVLLYTKAYGDLVRTLAALCAPAEGRPGGAAFHMSWQRRMPESAAFFEAARRRGFSVVQHPRLMFELRLSEGAPLD